MSNLFLLSVTLCAQTVIDPAYPANYYTDCYLIEPSVYDTQADCESMAAEFRKLPTRVMPNSECVIISNEY